VLVDIDGESTRVDEWSTLVNPGADSAGHRVLTGITNEMVRAAPPFATVAQDPDRPARRPVFVAHNARFDYGFLRPSSGAPTSRSRRRRSAPCG